jgi:predicted restriction endonuclease
MNNQDTIFRYISDNIAGKTLTDIITRLLANHDIREIEQIFDIEFDIVLDIEDIKKPKNDRQDTKFRESVRNMYDNKCMITGMDVVICDVAHILEYSKCMTVNERYDIYNGLLLSKNMHALFDKYYFSIDPETSRIKINKNIKGFDSVGLIEYENKLLTLRDESKKYLKIHYKNFLLSNNEIILELKK